MTNPLISVIIPVYNVEKYLCKCIDSVIAQTYNNLEIIIVDDGSTDGSGKICDEYAKRDKRIKAVHQENGGLSKARNTGLNIANGDYFAFVDSDDYISSDMYETMLSVSQTTKSDLTICSIIHEDENGNQKGKTNILQNDVLTNYDSLKMLQSNIYWLYVSACNKLYSKRLKEKLFFPIGKLNEDNFIAHEILYSCNSIATIENSFYHYLIRPGSISNSKVTLKAFDEIDSFLERINFYKVNNLYEFIPGAERQCLYWYKIKRVSFKPSSKAEKVIIKRIDKEMLTLFKESKNKKTIKDYLFFYFMPFYSWLSRQKIKTKKD